MRSLLPGSIALVLPFLLMASGRAGNDPLPNDALKQAIISSYANMAHAEYADALEGVRALEARVEAFLAAPEQDTLTRARTAWIDARVAYAQTEAFRFYDGPIESVEGLVNSWPIDENLIDYVEGEPDAGVINQPGRFPAITRDLIVSLNEKNGEKNITAGFHAIEFLLWGQDLNDNGPGVRSYEDYVAGGARHADRRRRYLATVVSLLVDDLERVVTEWTPGQATNYRARFLAMPADEALGDILKGIGILSGSELAGERLTVPYETKEQEDEHSCFSDNTHTDVLFNAVGIQNVFLGHYTRSSGQTVDGTGIRALIEHADAELARTLTNQIASSVALARAVPAPFDRAITGTDTRPGRVAVKQLIAALRAQADSIARAGTALGLKLNF